MGRLVSAFVVRMQQSVFLALRLNSNSTYSLFICTKGSLRRNYPYQKRWVVETFDPYWPDEVQGPVLFGDVVVTAKSETVLADYAIRVMEAKVVSLIKSRDVEYIFLCNVKSGP